MTIWRGLAATMLGALIVMVAGCGKRQSLFDPSPKVQDEVLRYGAGEAVARAEDHAEKAGNAEAYERLAQTYALANRPKQARRALEKAVSLDDTRPRAVVMLGRLLLAEGKPEAALSAVQRVLEKHPKVPEAYEIIVRSLIAERKFPEAQTAVEKGLAIARTPELLWAQADLFAAMGQWGRSYKAYDAALKLDPKNTKLEMAYAQSLVAGRHLDQAVKVMDTAAKQEPDTPEVRFLHASILQQAGKDAEAVAEYKQALLLRPNMLSAANNLAGLLADAQQDTEAAVHWAAVAARQAHGELAVRDTLGWALARDRQYVAGAKILREVLDKWPAKSPAIDMVRYHLGWTLSKQGKTAEAVELLEKAAEGPDSQAAGLAMAALKALRQPGEKVVPRMTVPAGA